MLWHYTRSPPLLLDALNPGWLQVPPQAAADGADDVGDTHDALLTPAAPPVSLRVERFDRRPIEPFELFTSEFGQNSVRIQKNSSRQDFSENFCKLRNSQHFLKYSAKFREIFVRIGAKFDEKVLKTSDFNRFYRNLSKIWKKV